MKDKDKLYILMQELNRANKRGLITRAAMERVLAPLSGMNEKLQDSYAEEMIPVLRTSEDEREVLVRMGLCIQLISEDTIMEGKRGENFENKTGSKNKRGREKKEKISQKIKDISEAKVENKKEGSEAEEEDIGIYLYRFSLPIYREEELYTAQAVENGGERFGYVDNAYPCGIFDKKELEEIIFSKITIFYGGNGSGKSTLLNLIADRLQLNRVAPYNSGELFASYQNACDYVLGHDDEGFALRIPSGSRIITSDDVFDYMLAMRTRNDEISESKRAVKNDYAKLKYGQSVKFRNMDDYEILRQQILARSSSVSRRQFIRRMAGQEEELGSNGETALAYFERKIRSKTLYCLDEPENSLSPAMQLELMKLLEKRVNEEECQLIMATHSPFLLAMQGAKVYNLDASPAQICSWWELENVRIYYDFFKEHQALFL